MKTWRVALAFALAALACHRTAENRTAVTERPNILLVTLDTTRADAIGPEAKGIQTPSFDALAAHGRRFRQAYATVPQTLPSHTSMLTGLYPAGHSIHENARYLAPNQTTVTEKLHDAGYRTAAFVSAFVLARRFGLARGFDVYDDDFGSDREERPGNETTDHALAFLSHPSNQPLFLWVHYWDPHHPYTPPEPYRSQFARNPYLGEVAFMDSQLGRLVDAFRKSVKGPTAIVVVGDHGEGLGEHGELQHGDLLYQSTMHVPLIVVGPGVTAGTSDTPVSTRRVFHTILDFAGIDSKDSLRGSDKEVVVGEAMKPFLDYGWQPQVMAVEGRDKSILAGKLEVYDVIADPGETHNLGDSASISREVRATLHDYPIPSTTAAEKPSALSAEDQKKLAALGYVGSDVKPVVRPDAPRPVDMAALIPILDESSGLFVRGQYAAAIPLLEKVLTADPNNLAAELHLATAYSSLGRNEQALAAFQKAEAIAPNSQDVRTYLALHYARTKDWPKAVPLLEQVVAESPDRLPAVEALAVCRERQGRIADAIAIWQKVYTMRTPSGPDLLHLGEMEMSLGQTAPAIDSFEKARAALGPEFKNDLELGVLYMAAGRMEDARAALDRVPPASPAYPMALFKRAQVSVLLHEPDAPARVAAARQHADATTRPLIARERLFAGL